MPRLGPYRNPTSAAAIVRHGLTRRQRLDVAIREPRMMQAIHDLNLDAVIVNEICRLCDEFKRKHGGK